MAKTLKPLFFIILGVLFFTACGKPKGKPSPGIAVKNDTTITVDSVSIDIKIPNGQQKGAILLFQGWNFPKTDWCAKSDFCTVALKRGYALVMPETGKTVYHSQIFPETRMDWRHYPTGTWIWDTLIPELQARFFLLEKGKPNFVAGISTGGRGAALACLNLPEIFTAGAALSGDFEQRMTPGDNLMTGYYGSIDSFPERWSGEDNPNANWRKWKTPFLIAHGKADTIVPFSQSATFYHTLHDSIHLQNLIFILPDSAGHDYGFWGKQTNEVLDFFDTFILSHP